MPEKLLDKSHQSIPRPEKKISEMPAATTTTATAAAFAAPPIRNHNVSLSPSFAAVSLPRLSSPVRLSVTCCTAITTDVSSSTSSSSSEEELQAEEEASRIGARIKVTAHVKVYHISKAPELDLYGLEGTIKQYVGLWKGKRISANLPFKVEFFVPVDGQPAPIKFFAHLKEDEFEIIQSD